MRTHVKRDGEDYILNGQKTFITNGPFADVMIVYAKLDEGGAGGAGTATEEEKRNRKVLTFVLDTGMEGLTQGAPLQKMGLHSSPTGELFFDNVRLGRDRLLGGSEDGRDGDGRESARSSFTAERIGVATIAQDHRGMSPALHRLLARADAVGSGDRPLPADPAQAGEDGGRADQRAEHGLPVHRAGPGRQAAMLSLAEASAMKLYSSEAATDVAMDAVQLFGGGYMAEYRVEQLARDAKSLMIYAGSNEIQVTHIAKGLLTR